MKHYKKNKIVLCISGFDPSGGAGLVNDIKTLASLDINALTIPTCLTVQTYNKFYKSYAIDINYITDTLTLLNKEYNIDAVKIGLINNLELLNYLNEFISNNSFKTIILDPIIVSSSGYNIWDDKILDIVVNKLLYQVDIITPNINEFNIIYKKIFSEPYQNLKEAIIKLQRKYSFKIAVTGGDLHTNNIINYYFDGISFKEHSVQKKININIHGTGCTFSSALLGFYLNLNDFIVSSINASSFVSEAINKHSIIKDSIVLNNYKKEFINL